MGIRRQAPTPIPPRTRPEVKQKRHRGKAIDWSFAGVLRSVPPVLVVAALGYALLGTLAALGMQAWRRRALSNETPPG